ncbi:helix-turn-helix domain-containing protein [Phaeovulum sp.]|uniref:helix-turn-helix domain-containing protein n=1 Tax=Phaeovulum sp. TaxID=2934796 RepID=UPI003567D679
MRDSELAQIRQLPLFRTMADDSFALLMRAAYDQTFPAFVQLIEQGAEPDFLHIVVEGSVELFARWQDRETTMAVVRPVSSFILAACIKDAPYLMAARTLEKTRIILLPSVDLRAVFQTDHKFAMATINELASCYRSVVRHAKDIKLRNARERLAAYILRKTRDSKSASFIIPVEKRLLASYLGVTPESLSRTMKSLQEVGAKVDGQRVIITDRKALEAVAHPSPLIDGPDCDDEAALAGAALLDDGDDDESVVARPYTY